MEKEESINQAKWAAGIGNRHGAIPGQSYLVLHVTKGLAATGPRPVAGLCRGRRLPRLPAGVAWPSHGPRRAVAAAGAPAQVHVVRSVVPRGSLPRRKIPEPPAAGELPLALRPPPCRPTPSAYAVPGGSAPTAIATKQPATRSAANTRGAYDRLLNST